MLRILADRDSEGHAARIVRIFDRDWPEFWRSLEGELVTFSQVGLDSQASDRTVWRLCQLQRLVLLTNNRNADGETSLETTLRLENTSECLPVLTIADGKRFMKDTPYREKAAEKILQYLLDLPSHLGTGRLYVP